MAVTPDRAVLISDKRPYVYLNDRDVKEDENLLIDVEEWRTM